MSHNLYLVDEAEGDPEVGSLIIGFLWQTPTVVTERLLALGTTYRVAAGYLDWMREECLHLPPVTPLVRVASALPDAELWIAPDKDLAPFRGKMRDVRVYVEHEQQLLAHLARGCTFSWI